MDDFIIGVTCIVGIVMWVIFTIVPTDYTTYIEKRTSGGYTQYSAVRRFPR